MSNLAEAKLQFIWSMFGNEKCLLELEQNLQQQKLAQAYLFSGPIEVGKFTTAKDFAKLILCEQRACGNCAICQKITANIYPELTVVDELWIEGQQEDLIHIAQKSNFNQLHRTKTPKAKTDTLGIQDLREILRRINVKQSNYQIFLLRNIERFTLEAANFFLKTLEEPPAKTIFLLTTNNLAQVLPTIISRCRVLNFYSVATARLKDYLRENFAQLAPLAHQQILHLALGKPQRALRLAQDPTHLQEFCTYFTMLKELFAQPDLATKLQLAEQLTTNKAELQKFLEVCHYFLRSFLLTRARNAQPESRYSAQKLLTIIQNLTETQILIWQQNVNPRLALENFLIKI